ncbi:uncharacterized protein LOC126844622 isoform X2 [Adelges cooleyi]|uniref:uncharacterized protein LOC126844622 isoform X2 n=1 Tax=Adelges cooleyi TaxID=133065 RepID=UPI00218087AB|nr:uncharacterized protein LOC126844622 isoform X2 [Adelges cooleyi]
MVASFYITISLCVFVTFFALSATFSCFQPQTLDEEHRVKKLKSRKSFGSISSKWPKVRRMFNTKNKFTDTQKTPVSLKKNGIDQEDANIPTLAPSIPGAYNPMIQNEEDLFSTPLESFRYSSEITGIEDDEEFHSARFEIQLPNDEESRENKDFEPSQIINDPSQVSDSHKSIEITQDNRMNNQDILHIPELPRPAEIIQENLINNQDNLNLILSGEQSPLSNNEEDSETVNVNPMYQYTDNFFYDAMEVFYRCILVHPVLRYDTTFLGSKMVHFHMNNVITNWACHMLKRRPYATKKAVMDDISQELCNRLSDRGKKEIDGYDNCIEVVLICSEKFTTRLLDLSNVYSVHSFYGSIISPPIDVDPPPKNEDEYNVIIFCPYGGPEDTQMSPPILADQQNDLLGT